MMKVIFLLRCDYVHDEGDLFVNPLAYYFL